MIYPGIKNCACLVDSVAVIAVGVGCSRIT